MAGSFGSRVSPVPKVTPAQKPGCQWHVVYRIPLVMAVPHSSPCCPQASLKQQSGQLAGKQAQVNSLHEQLSSQRAYSDSQTAQLVDLLHKNGQLKQAALRAANENVPGPNEGVGEVQQSDLAGDGDVGGVEDGGVWAVLGRPRATEGHVRCALCR